MIKDFTAVQEVQKLFCVCGGRLRGVGTLVDDESKSFLDRHCCSHISAGETAGWKSLPSDHVISEAKVLQFV